MQGEREGADAVIDGVIKSFNFSGVLLDERGRARIFEVTIEAAVTVRDQVENRVLYDNQNFVFRGEYEVRGSPQGIAFAVGRQQGQLSSTTSKSSTTGRGGTRR